MGVAIQTLLGSDNGADRVSRANANFAALLVDTNFDQSASSDLTIPTNRTQIVYQSLTLAGTTTLTIQGTGILAIIG